ncbi:ornithine cyclodeaminase family protein [Acidobacteriia bacterium AH_259_A11_L15]|nr:ornithine cyclodeaminase family protein [Acidobacteriia bacterium AH_259_A11_L15]
MLILNRKMVETLLDFDQLLKSLARAMAELSTGSVSMPSRVAATVPEQGGLLAVMPAYLPSSKALEIKLVSIFPKNSGLGLPTHWAVVVVFDPATGSPLALMDGEHITAVRTAAGSALATQLLARSDAEVLAVLGTGVQARSHLRAIPRVRPVREVRIAGRNEQKARALAQEASRELGRPVQAASSYREAVAGADIVCATTHSPDPVVEREWLKPGVHVNSVGFNPKGREIDEDTVADALVVVESREAALAPPPSGANDLTWPIRAGRITEKHIHAEIGELIAGTCTGRSSPEQITLYKSVGVAVEDAVAAQLVLAAARERGVGVEVEL